MTPVTPAASNRASTPLPGEPPAIVLVRPQEEGNVGAVARAMANFGLERLILVEPATPLRGTARAFAVHAHEILERAERVEDLAAALAGFERIVATTAARDRPWPSRLLAPRELARALADDPPGTSTALVFGPEPSGLTNAELARASLLVRVPTSPVQPSLNLGQAVVVVAYELFVSGRQPPPGADGETLASGEEVAGLFGQASELLERIGFARDATIDGVERDLRRLLARAAPSQREVTLLRGVLRRLGHALERAR